MCACTRPTTAVSDPVLLIESAHEFLLCDFFRRGVWGFVGTRFVCFQERPPGIALIWRDRFWSTRVRVRFGGEGSVPLLAQSEYDDSLCLCCRQLGVAGTGTLGARREQLARFWCGLGCLYKKWPTVYCCYWALECVLLSAELMER